jgi:predicted RNA methylase
MDALADPPLPLHGKHLQRGVRAAVTCARELSRFVERSEADRIALALLAHRTPALPALDEEALRTVEVLRQQPLSIDALSLAYEALSSESRGAAHRKERGVFYTPPELAAQVVALACAHGGLPERPRVYDCCAGAGVFLIAAARALSARGIPIEDAVQLCAGSDLDAGALEVARTALGLLGNVSGDPPGPRIWLEPLDALREDPARAGLGPIDLLITNPPYGHAQAGRPRASLLRRFPELKGSEIDLYAAFILRSLELVRPGGTAALLVPDTWMTNARAAALRESVLARAELLCVSDLGKPFAAAKDTRVQAIVLRRRRKIALNSNEISLRANENGLHANDLGARPILAFRGLTQLSSLDEPTLRAQARRGWQPYRSAGERALCEAMERASVPLEQLCSVGYGLRTGNNPRHVARGEKPPEAHALVGGEEIEPFHLKPTQKWLRDPTPELRKLVAKQLGHPRVAIQRIRTNAAVPWARWLEAAWVTEELICLDSLSTLATSSDQEDLLWALLALVGSVAMNRYHRLQTTDVNVKPSQLRTLPAPRLLADQDKRTKIVTLSKKRAAERDPQRAHQLERTIDREVYALYRLDEPLVDQCEETFWGERHAAERALLPP